MLFFDTYALIEIIEGSPPYQKYAKEEFITTKYNLMELYYILLRTLGAKKAEHYFNTFLPSCVPVEDETLKAAMRFRVVQRKEKNLISYVDCVGYFVALQYGVRFLTGEKHFKNLQHVEFVP
jgi:predicted nucleic acid-binding protein|tara:strand:- start:808 stop:1173 length:366 start_codon:yes stop_codon:yes gene_type:complete